MPLREFSGNFSHINLKEFTGTFGKPGQTIETVKSLPPVLPETYMSFRATPEKGFLKSASEKTLDSGIGLVKGAVGIVKGVSDNIKAGDNPVSEYLDGVIKKADTYVSPDTKGAIMWRQTLIDQAEKHGNDGAGTRVAINTLLNNPTAGLHIASQGAGSAGAIYLAARAGAPAGLLALLSALSNGGDAANQAAQQLKAMPEEVWMKIQKYKNLIDQGMAPQDAKKELLPTIVLPAQVAGTAIGAISGKTGLEKTLSGQATKAGLNAALKQVGAELAGEEAESIVPQIASNAVARHYDNTTPLDKGMGQTAVDTAVGAFPGSALAARHSPAQEVQPRQPAQPKEIKALTYLNADHSSDPSRNAAPKLREFTGELDQPRKEPADKNASAPPNETDNQVNAGNRTAVKPIVDRANEQSEIVQLSGSVPDPARLEPVLVQDLPTGERKLNQDVVAALENTQSGTIQGQDAQGLSLSIPAISDQTEETTIASDTPKQIPAETAFALTQEAEKRNRTAEAHARSSGKQEIASEEELQAAVRGRLQQSTFKSGADAAEAGVRSAADARGINSVLAKNHSVNPDNMMSLQSSGNQTVAEAKQISNESDPGFAREKDVAEELSGVNEHRRFLDGKPVAELNGSEFARDGVPLTEKVPKWYAQHGFSQVKVRGIGIVALDERAVKDSMAHGIGRDKAAAFAAVPDVLQKGRLVHSEPSTRDDHITGHFIAAPIRMSGKDYVAVVLVRSDKTKNRMYVHEVALREKLQQSAFKTEASTATNGALNGANAGAIRSVLAKIYSVNPDANGPHLTNGNRIAIEAKQVSKELDANRAMAKGIDDVLFSRKDEPQQNNEHRRFLDGEPVVELKGNQFASDGVPLTEKVPKWYAEHGYSQVNVKGIGSVTLDKRAVSASFSHGIGRDKATAFAAVPDVLMHGRIIHQEPLRENQERGQMFHVAAPVRIGNRDMIEVVLVKSEPNMRRMYVHEVVLREKLQQSTFKSGASAAEADGQSAADAGAIRSVLTKIYSVNPDEPDGMMPRSDNASEFVKAPDGSIDFGEIIPEMAAVMKRQAGKVRLERGDTQYGEVHIENNHGRQIRAAGYDSIPEFVAEALKNIHAIWKPDKSSQLVVIEAGEKQNAVFIELRPARDEGEDYYRVNSGFPVRRDYIGKKQQKGWVKLWDNMALSSKTSGESSRFAVSPQKTGEAVTIPSDQSNKNTNTESEEESRKPQNKPLFAHKRNASSTMQAQDVRNAIASDIFNHDIDVYPTWEDVPEYIQKQAEDEGGGEVEGFWDMAKNKVALIAENLDSPERARQVARHELIGHYGLENMLQDSANPDAMTKLVKRVIQAEKEGNKTIVELGKQVDHTQPDLSPERRAKEIMAVMAERNLQNAITKRIYDLIRKFLKKIGFIKSDITDAKVADLLREAQAYLRETGRGTLIELQSAFSPGKEPAVLDLPKPLTVQPESVRRALRAEIKRQWIDADNQGFDFEDGITGQNLVDTIAKRLGSETNAHEYLASLGVTGLKAKDGAETSLQEYAYSKSAMKSPEANIKRGRDNMNRALVEKDTVHRAMFRTGMGWVDFVWGDGNKGLQHVIERRVSQDGMTEAEVYRLLENRIVPSIAKGEEIRRKEIKKSDEVLSTRVVVEYDGVEAVLVKNRGANAWVLSGWEVHSPGNSKAANDTKEPTHRTADSSDGNVGAGELDVNITKGDAPGNKGRFSRGKNLQADSKLNNHAVHRLFGLTATNRSVAGQRRKLHGKNAYGFIDEPLNPLMAKAAYARSELRQ